MFEFDRIHSRIKYLQSFAPETYLQEKWLEHQYSAVCREILESGLPENEKDVLLKMVTWRL